MNFKLFYSKCPQRIDDVIFNDDKTITATFINFISFTTAIESDVDYTQFDYLISDGLVMTKLNNLCSAKKTIRISFDFSSFAPIIFDKCERESKSVFLLGGTPDEAKDFTASVKERFKDLNIVCQSGFFENKTKLLQEIEEIGKKNYDVVVLGLGCPLQDEMALELRKLNKTSNIYTCGAFISQVGANKELHYFPPLINKLGLRFLHRLIFEKHTRMRMIKAMFKFSKVLLNYGKYKGE